jgi:hypothetical protein
MKFMLGLAIGATLAGACEAQSSGGLADVAIIDRDSGVALSPHYYRGEYWVAGRPGARYAVEIRNRLGERLLAVTSVDGVNVLSGATAAWDQAGYVFEAGERYQITGWRKSDAQVAAFTFTESPNSYAERTGRPANVGVIGVAFYRERQPQAISGPGRLGHAPVRPDSLREGAENVPPILGGSAPPDEAQSRAQDSTSAGIPETQVAPSPGQTLRVVPALPAPAPAPKLGTGHGEREYSYVTHTEFLRMQPQPNEVVRIRYDSMDNLLALGIIKRPRRMPPTANPFPASPEQQYVPDPG